MYASKMFAICPFCVAKNIFFIFHSLYTKYTVLHILLKQLY